MKKSVIIGIVVVLVIIGIVFKGIYVKQEETITYQEVNVQGFSIEIIDNMEKFMERTESLPNSYLTIYAHPVEGAYDAFVGIGWDTKALAEAAKVNTVLDYLDANVKGFKKLWGGSDYAQFDGGVLTINGHEAKFIIYTYVTQKGFPSKVKLTAWFCESTQRYYNIMFTSPEEVLDKYVSAYEHAETTMECHEIAGNCEKMTGSVKDECYFTLALTTKNISLCEKVIESTPKKICYAVVTNNAGLCEEITDSAGKDSCYGTYAVKNDDRSICEKMIDSTEKNKCYDIVEG